MVVAFQNLGDPGIAAGQVRTQQPLGNSLVVVMGLHMGAACLRKCHQAHRGTLGARTLAPWLSGTRLGRWEQNHHQKLRKYIEEDIIGSELHYVMREESTHAFVGHALVGGKGSQKGCLAAVIASHT